MLWAEYKIRERPQMSPPRADSRWPQLASDDCCSLVFKRSSNTRTKQQTQTHQYGPVQIIPGNDDDGDYKDKTCNMRSEHAVCVCDELRLEESA